MAYRVQTADGDLLVRMNDWVDADFRLPSTHDLPVEVILRTGSQDVWHSISMDWREVARWRRSNQPKKKK